MLTADHGIFWRQSQVNGSSRSQTQLLHKACLIFGTDILPGLLKKGTVDRQAKVASMFPNSGSVRARSSKKTKQNLPAWTHSQVSTPSSYGLPLHIPTSKHKRKERKDVSSISPLKAAVAYGHNIVSPAWREFFFLT